MSIASAVFDTRLEAEKAVVDLRSAGIRDDAISIIAQHDGQNTAVDGAGEHEAPVSGNFVKGAAAGAGLGAIAGIAALAIPAVGPFVAAGAIAQSAIGGGALAGAAVGAAAGGLAGALSKHGVDEDDAGFYEGRINNGGVFVSVDTDASGLDRQTAEDILYRTGGYNSRRGKTMAASPVSPI